ncbi:DEAD/DEAH box helicase [Nocardioides anomalus]|uniref:DEAD/DEAH box helicase n=1 Tax=Nocardioides anomalus TaxID=2712223 RepID=A0A6G6WGS9_9ACTN|nr:DEAD/DEAH box helicase [Nocardioides anomalus]QIG44260.1 DEAD/DEAH box helicase [Nocardioides anomalus]
MARRGQRQSGNRQANQRNNQRRHGDNEGIIPVLARAVREVEARAQRGPVSPSARTKFQVIALLVREERARIKADTELTEAKKADQLKRLDGVATILAKTTATDPTLFALLAEDAKVSDAAKELRREMIASAGMEAEVEPEPEPEAAAALTGHERRVVPTSVKQRLLSNPFLVPDFSAADEHRPRARRLASWELLGPLFRSFEYNGGAACMPLPEPNGTRVPDGLELMRHQAQLVHSAADGHRTYLLADEPGLGKTAQALLAAQAADAFPLLAVVPNVVKTNWAREAGIWVPNRPVTVIHGDGEDVDGFADIVVVNYEILDRHVGWLGDFGFRGMVVDEAHFIKNKQSQRSQNVLNLSERIRARRARPLLMALTGTPLINDIEDFQAIWEFLGWIDDKKPLSPLMDKLEETGLTPADPPFYPAARTAVVDMGIVRRRKVDVAADIPARRIADIPVELDDDIGRSIREAERQLAQHLLERYDMAIATRRSGAPVEGIDHELVRRVATWEREDTGTTANPDGDNVFTMLRRIGQAKAGLAADYAAQLARSVGKVVFFAKHVDVMDLAGETFAKRGIRYSQIRGDQTPKSREANIEAFQQDPDVQIIVCSLMAAGVGINLQVSSNVVLAELSWTDAEQTQAIDRVHRIGQAEPVTAWRIIASQTIDTKIAELIDSKAGLAARALDGSDDEVGSSVDIQLEALVALLTSALEEREGLLSL